MTNKQAMVNLSDEVGMSEFITRVGGGEYQVIFKTNSNENYHAVEDFCREIIGHGKPSGDQRKGQDAVNQLSDPDRVRVVRCRDCVEWESPTKAEQSEGGTFGHCRCRFGTCYGQKTDMNWFCADGEREE